MNFEAFEKDIKSIPVELSGFWYKNSTRYEFREDGRYFITDRPCPIQFEDSGDTLILNGERFRRLYGAAGLTAVWRSEAGSDREFLFRNDSTFTAHNSFADFSGEYSVENGILTLHHLRALFSVNGEMIKFFPQFAESEEGQWSVQDSSLTVEISGGSFSYERESADS